MPEYTPFQWPKSKKTSTRRVTRKIVVHCAATPEGKHFDAADINRMHLDRGWAGIGYHFVVLLDGTIEAGRPENAIGAHVSGHNSDSIGVVYIGGVDAAGRPKDTRTEEQKDALEMLLKHLVAKYRGASICGHRDFKGVAKACPSFDALTAYKHII